MKEYRFEQYKIFVESAEKNSEKRVTQNNIYLTINLAFLSYILFQKPNLVETIITSFASNETFRTSVFTTEPAIPPT